MPFYPRRVKKLRKLVRVGLSAMSSDVKNFFFALVFFFFYLVFFVFFVFFFCFFYSFHLEKYSKFVFNIKLSKQHQIVLTH